MDDCTDCCSIINIKTWLKACSLITNAGAKLCAEFREVPVNGIPIICKNDNQYN